MYEKNKTSAAFAIALRVTRIPEPGVICCQSGGFVARYSLFFCFLWNLYWQMMTTNNMCCSGSFSPDKSPSVFLPRDIVEFAAEGFGEVQTPLKLPRGMNVQIGQVILIRPAKSGEISERFNEYLCVRNGNVVERSKTYRGHGKAFY